MAHTHTVFFFEPVDELFLSWTGIATGLGSKGGALRIGVGIAAFGSSVGGLEIVGLGWVILIKLGFVVWVWIVWWGVVGGSERCKKVGFGVVHRGDKYRS